MNISDVTIDYKAYDGKDRLDVVFSKHNALRELYGIPILELDLPEHQHIAREFAWNVCEETGEALEVFLGTKNEEHIKDEVADAFGFYLELMLMCGMKWDDVLPPKEWAADSLESWFLEAHLHYMGKELREIHSIFLEKLALAINNLKNRKWRKTNLKTNKLIYRKALLDTFEPFIAFVEKVGLDHIGLFDAYLRKWEVNMFRIKSKY